MSEQNPPAGLNPRPPFDGVVGRASVDYFLRNIQQQLVALGGQADFKASVMITASSIIVSIVATQLDDDPIGIAAGVVACFVLVALLASVIAVFPKFRRHRHGGSDTTELPEHFNVVFFGHYAQIPKEQFLTELSAVAEDDGAVYRAIAGDLYDQGFYLVNQKYQYLRISYAAFLTGFVLGPIVYLVGTTVS